MMAIAWMAKDRPFSCLAAPSLLMLNMNSWIPVKSALTKSLPVLGSVCGAASFSNALLSFC